MSRIASSISSLKLVFGRRSSVVGKFFLMSAVWCLMSGCGFHPVYGKSESNVSAQLASVRIETIPGREGQIIQNKLAYLLNPTNQNAPAAYSLIVTVKDQHSELGINTDLRVTRYDVIPNANYSLISLDTNKVVDTGHVRIKSSYNRTVSEFATFVAEQNAAELADNEAAEEIRSRLIYYFSK